MSNQQPTRKEIVNLLNNRLAEVISIRNKKRKGKINQQWLHLSLNEETTTKSIIGLVERGGTYQIQNGFIRTMIGNLSILVDAKLDYIEPATGN